MALPAGGGSTLPVPLDTFSGRHRTLGYAVNGIPLPTQPYLATAPVVQGSLINTGKRFTLFFASPDSQTLALLTSGAIVTLQFLLADGRAPSATVQITSSLSNATLLVDVLLLKNAPVLPSSSPFIHLKQDGSLMTANVFGEIPNDIKDKPILGLYDPVTHAAVAAQAGTTVTDGTNSVVYAPLAGGGGGGGTQYTDGATPPANPIGGALIYDNAGAWVDVGTDHGLPITVNNANPNGQATTANSSPVTWASNQTPLTSSTATKANVAGSVSSVTILAANNNRKQALIYNDSTALLYLDLTGGTASSSSYSVQVPAQGYFELPPQPIYTGLITGIWSVATGNARVTEFS